MGACERSALVVCMMRHWPEVRGLVTWGGFSLQGRGLALFRTLVWGLSWVGVLVSVPIRRGGRRCRGTGWGE